MFIRRLLSEPFHSIALSQLKRLPRSYRSKRLLSEGERLALLRRCIAQHSIAASFEEAIKFIDSAKTRISSNIDKPRFGADLQHLSGETLASEGSMDFSDSSNSIQKMHAS